MRCGTSYLSLRIFPKRSKKVCRIGVSDSYFRYNIPIDAFWFLLNRIFLFSFVCMCEPRSTVAHIISIEIGFLLTAAQNPRSAYLGSVSFK